MAQNGGNGWALTFDIDSSGVVINLAGLNSVTFSPSRTRATIGGGATVKRTIDAAYAAGAFVQTGNCNCVGTLGAMLGGGYGNLLGRQGFAVDTVLSMRVVLADGTAHDVTKNKNPDLFWALRGAGPNLGVVTSATVQAIPTDQQDMVAWMGSLVYSPDKLEALVEAIEALHLSPDMVIFLYMLPDPTGSPSIIAAPVLLQGTAEEGRDAFSSLYDVGPFVDTTSVVPYNHWNDASDAFCQRGGFKPGWGTGFQSMRKGTWREIWNQYLAFQSRPGATGSGVLMEAYSLDKAKSFGADSSAFPHRNVRFNAFAVPMYSDPALHTAARAFGTTVRALLKENDGLPIDQT